MTELEPNQLPELVAQFLPETLEQSKINKVRSILGEAVRGIPDTQLESLIAQCEYLVNAWMDEYERILFEGKTLKEMM